VILSLRVQWGGRRGQKAKQAMADGMSRSELRQLEQVHRPVAAARCAALRLPQAPCIVGCHPTSSKEQRN